MRVTPTNPGGGMDVSMDAVIPPSEGIAMLGAGWMLLIEGDAPGGPGSSTPGGSSSGKH